MCVEAAALLNKNEKSKGYKIDFFKRQTLLPGHAWRIWPKPAMPIGLE